MDAIKALIEVARARQEEQRATLKRIVAELIFKAAIRPDVKIGRRI